jgi:hypothetical protein
MGTVAYKILIGKLQAKSYLEDLVVEGEDLKGIGSEGVD